MFNINFFEVNVNENISTILETLLLGCRLVIFVFDLANQISFRKVMRLVNKIDDIESAHDIFKIIIGNKTDLKEDKKYGNEKIYVLLNFIMSIENKLRKKLKLA